MAGIIVVLFINVSEKPRVVPNTVGWQLIFVKYMK